MNKTSEQDILLLGLEDNANALRKTLSNWRKTPKARITKGYVEARLKIVQEYWSALKENHIMLSNSTPKAERDKLPYFVNDEYYTYEELYIQIQSELNDAYSLFKPQASQLSSTSTSASEQCNHHNGFVHLPKIQLPTFSSSYEGWPAFKDLFTSLVHDNSALSDVQRLHYLKTSLKGEAESLLQHIQITESNYKVAWDILNSRYGNKRFIINNIMKRLFSQKKMTSPSAAQIKGLVDTTTECLTNLNNLKIATGSWDLLIIHLLVQKLDSETHKDWEQHVSDQCESEDFDQVMTWTKFKNFMETRFQTMELLTSHAIQTKPIRETRSHYVANPTTEKICIMCSNNHTLSHCKTFIGLDTTKRNEYVKNKQLCYNCLAPGHSVSRCKLPVSCQICKKRHHSLLHETKNTEPAASTGTSTSQPLASQYAVEDEVQVNTTIASHLSTKQGVALLATAVVEATNEHGLTIPLRALIDQGSQATFISEKATQLLKLNRQPVKGIVVGVGSTKTEIKHAVQLQLTSKCNRNFKIAIEAYVMSKQLTTKIPTQTIPVKNWPHLQGLKLADPTYFQSGSIDILLGVREYAQIIQQDLIKGPPGTPCAQNTSLGWILFGDINRQPTEDTYLVMHHQVDIDEMLKSIWELESDNKRHLTREEKLCEEIYDKTTTRNQDGRYIVKLPFKKYSPQANETQATSTQANETQATSTQANETQATSTQATETQANNTKDIAIHRFLQLERKFKKSPEFKREYTQVIDDYIQQGHMEEIPKEERDARQSVYLPHHAVIRNDKETSRTRVVFDASCKGKNQISLNDELHVGPQLQEDLRYLLTRWRMKRVCFMADIRQMYRQILVSKEDADLQRIIWRKDEASDLKEYRLLRVTFGTAPAPYLAVKTLHQVATDEGENKPVAAQSIKNNFYMDDWLDGADDDKSAIALAQDVEHILKKGGFELTKWSSNNIKFMKAIDTEKRSAKAHIDMNLDGTIKALGIVWNLNDDTFQYNLKIPSTNKSITKRGILSDIQKQFDPLGWIAASTVLLKLLIQKLWLEKVTWDEEVSEELQEEWIKIKTDFANVNNIQIPRWVGTYNALNIDIQLHGFSDASMRAYAAAVYIRVELPDGTIKTNLIAARTRVAPLKTISLPRLELSGALLLSKLMKQVGEAMRISTGNMYAWTDSSIVIAWMSGEPSRWKPFVANRVVEIAENLNNKQFYHVESSYNPADLASRGIMLSDLKTSDLWWKGPSWLSETEIKISKQEIIPTEMEMKPVKTKTYLNVEDEDKSITEEFENFDTLTELLKVITFCKRFINYKRNTNIEKVITTLELEEALITCVKKVQEKEFKQEIDRLKDGKEVKRTSPLRFLNPYLDEKQVLRVGGRLKHANLPEETKHPIILGNKNELTPLIIADAHVKTLHGGVQLMLCYLRSKYWIMKAKSMTKMYVRKCLICAKLKARARTQIMGDLPSQRVTPARPFLHSGVDFLGPFQILMSKGRGNKTTKMYVAIFVCMVTKNTHLELVGDMTSESFIGAFRRFVARRGKCSHLWSDQGRNFIGANKELRDDLNETLQLLTGDIAQMLAVDGTQWHYIPAYSPSFGGLWETGVKSVKYHLKRIITTHLTYEEMTTLLCQIEACLNSRPLCPLDETDPSDTNPLTPGHFLIGEAPIVVPSPDQRDVKMTNLCRWKHTQKLFNDFWRRWQDEYLTRLQQRNKWLKKDDGFKIGDIVLIKTDNLPPGKWSLGRIVDKHPGTDGFTRVYSVKSGSSVTKRTVTKLCALPIEST